jgi:glycine/D-amino acid oxidase-like deaminating enzyme
LGVSVSVAGGPRVIVVGAGIIGLATAFELSERGARVEVVADEPPGSLQSAGPSRIFRLSHDDADLVDAARAALHGWERWERIVESKLLVRCGLLLTGDVTSRLEHLDAGEVAGPFDAPRHPLSAFGGPWWFETTGAAGRIEAAIAGLVRRVSILRARVASVDAAGVTLVSGKRLGADRVVVCAGAGTHELVGIPQPQLFQYARFSFPLRRPLRSAAPCWMQRDPDLSDPFYAVPIGEDRYGVGLSEGVPAEVAEADHLADHRERVTAIVTELLDGLDPTAVDVVRCAYPAAAGSSPAALTHDGWEVDEARGVVYVVGPNLFKFAPYLGQLAANRVAPVSATSG